MKTVEGRRSSDGGLASPLLCCVASVLSQLENVQIHEV